jgi:ubiquitin carboxyl-terminal hydrolase 9/13
MKGLFGIGSRGNGVSSSSSLRASSLLGGGTPVKKDPQTPQITPLEKRLQDMGPIRVDGSDKFFGMENVSVLAISVIYTR